MDLLICHHCGNVIRERDKFCSECGLKVSAISATTASRSQINLEPLTVALSSSGKTAKPGQTGAHAGAATPSDAYPIVQPKQRDFFADAPAVVPVLSTSPVPYSVAPEESIAVPDAVRTVIGIKPEKQQANIGEQASLAAPPGDAPARNAAVQIKGKAMNSRPALAAKGAGRMLKKLIDRRWQLMPALTVVASVVVIFLVVNGAGFLSAWSDEGIWLLKYVPISMQARTSYVQLKRQGNQLIGTPLVGGSDGVEGQIYPSGAVVLLQRQPLSMLHPIKFQGIGSLKEGSFGGRLVAGGQGTWTAKRVQAMELLFHPPSADWLRDQFLKVLLGFLFLSGVLVWISVKLFAPNGFVNIKSRKQYVPDRYKAEHARMLWQYGRSLTADSLPLGTRVDWSPWHLAPRTLNLPPEIRRKDPHVLMIGGSGKGKTRLMASMAAHDIESGERAVVIVDPDGALSDLICRYIAAHKERAAIVKRLRIIDGTREEPLSFNPIAVPGDGQLQNMASSVVAGFRAIYTPAPGTQQTWSQQTAHILRSALLLLAVNGRSLADLPILLTDNDQRDLLLQALEIRRSESAEMLMILESWSRYRKLARSDNWLDWVEPILNRVQPVLGDPKLNAIIATGKHDVDFAHVIRNKGIILLKLPRSRFGDHASLVGSLLVGCLQNAALSLATEDESQFPTSLFLDDFAAFIDKDMFQLVTGDTRRYGIGLVCSARTLQDVPEDYRNLVLNSVGTLAAFACGPKDAEALGKQIFRVDGRQAKQRTIANIFNSVNTTIASYDLITDEEKLNIDRIIGQDDQVYFCYRVGSIAGVFNLKAPFFEDIDKSKFDLKLLSKAYKPYKEKEVKKEG